MWKGMMGLQYLRLLIWTVRLTFSGKLKLAKTKPKPRDNICEWYTSLCVSSNLTFDKQASTKALPLLLRSSSHYKILLVSLNPPLQPSSHLSLSPPPSPLLPVPYLCSPLEGTTPHLQPPSPPPRPTQEDGHPHLALNHLKPKPNP